MKPSDDIPSLMTMTPRVSMIWPYTLSSPLLPWPQTSSHLSGPKPPQTHLCHISCTLGQGCSPRSSDVCPLFLVIQAAAPMTPPQTYPRHPTSHKMVTCSVPKTALSTWPVFKIEPVHKLKTIYYSPYYVPGTVFGWEYNIYKMHSFL